MGIMITLLLCVSGPAFVSADSTPAPAGSAGSSGSSADLLPLAGSGNTTTDNPYSGIPQLSAGTATDRFNYLAGSVITNARYLIGAVAVALLVYAGVRMVIAQGNPEEYTTQKRNIIYAIIGLAVVGFSGDLVRIFNVYCNNGKDLNGLPCTAGGFLNGPNAIVRTATLFNQRTQFLITFIKYIIGSIAVFMTIQSGLRLITSSGKEEKLAEDKKRLFYGVLGLLFIIMADPLINNVFYKINLAQYPSVGGAAPGIDTVQGAKELAGFTNLVVTLATPVAILMLLYAAFMYLSSAGKEEQQAKAKRLIFAVIAGILIMYAAFAIVSTVISGQFQAGGAGTVTTTDTTGP